MPHSTMRLHCGALLGCVGLLLAARPAAAFDFDDVAQRAHDIAAKSYKAPPGKLPAALADLTYDQFRDIRFKPDRSLWRNAGLPFELQFFHPGWLFKDPVQIHLVTAHGVRDYPFDPASFDYGKNALDRKALGKVGYAGFRIHYPINKKDYKDEVAVFLGASYLRAVGRNQGYGMSARGLAIDTALPSGEEFPAFREFWIERPAADATALVVYALLDSRRAAGAYRFVVRPGENTVIDVHARLFLREAVGKLGLAPLNSMYFFGENQPAPAEDFRPEVHDSDGLLVAGGDGEWIWRPLVNPKRLLVTSFAQRGVKGFGLLQRDRAFVHYEDLEARYERRPSAWVEPQGDWGTGRVELVQIPTANEFNDNIVAYWVPDTPPAPGAPLDLSYRLSWKVDDVTVPTLAHVTQTRRGAAGENTELFIVDFQGGGFGPDADLQPTVWCDSHGEVLEQRAYPNDAVGGWRLALTVKRKDKEEPVELRASLAGKDGQATETWSYVWPPP